jgi:hypothetical protein
MFNWSEISNEAFIVHGFRLTECKPDTMRIANDLQVHVDIIDLLFEMAWRHPLNALRPLHQANYPKLGFNDIIDLIAATRTPRWEPNGSAHMSLLAIQENPSVLSDVTARLFGISAVLADIILFSFRHPA